MAEALYRRQSAWRAMAGFAAFSSLRPMREFRSVVSMVTARDDSQGSQAEPLKWDVFVTTGIPIAMAERPAGVRETYFQAMASTLIYGKRDALLVDAFMTVEQATALANWVASKKKNLTTIYITHGHGDHWFGVGTILKRFPNARVVATRNTINVMRQNAS